MSGLHQSALLWVKCPAFPSPKLIMPCIPHVRLQAFRVICTGCIVPPSPRCIFAHLSISRPVFCTCKKMLQVSLRPMVVPCSKALQHFAEGNSHSKATTQPWENSRSCLGCCRNIAVADGYALLETFGSPHSIAGSRWPCLGWGSSC